MLTTFDRTKRLVPREVNKTHPLVRVNGRDKAKCGSLDVHCHGRGRLTYFGQRVTCPACREAK